MCFEMFNNPMVFATIIAAILGAFIAWVLALFTENYRFNKKKRGAYALLKSEIFLYIDSLKDYEENYLRNDINNANDEKYKKELENFYKNLKFFPKYENEKWDKLTSFIPSIMNQNQIIQISKFYQKYDKIYMVSINLSNKIAKPKIYLEYPDETKKVMGYEKVKYNEINNERIYFKNEVRQLIEDGESILSFLDKNIEKNLNKKLTVKKLQ